MFTCHSKILTEVLSVEYSTRRLTYESLQLERRSTLVEEVWCISECSCGSTARSHVDIRTVCPTETRWWRSLHKMHFTFKVKVNIYKLEQDLSSPDGLCVKRSMVATQ